MTSSLFVNTHESDPKRRCYSAKQSKAYTIIELKQMPSQVSQEMNVKEMKNILHDYIPFEKIHSIKTQKNAKGQCLNETVS